jgi:hypothetical protein
VKGTKRPHAPEDCPHKPENKKQKASVDKDKVKESDKNDVSSIHLHGEEDGAVPIFDTCDDIRKKINDYLKKEPKATQAGLARELSNHLPDDEKVDGRQMGAFLKKKGPCDGGHSPVFYAAYVYFEKLRVKDNKKKSKKREEMEEAWAEEGGFPREGSHNMYFTTFPGEGRPTLDRLGQVKLTGGSSMSGGIKRKRVK